MCRCAQESILWVNFCISTASSFLTSLITTSNVRNASCFWSLACWLVAKQHNNAEDVECADNAFWKWQLAKWCFSCLQRCFMIPVKPKCAKIIVIRGGSKPGYAINGGFFGNMWKHARTTKLIQENSHYEFSFSLSNSKSPSFHVGCFSFISSSFFNFY